MSNLLKKNVIASPGLFSRNKNELTFLLQKNIISVVLSFRSNSDSVFQGFGKTKFANGVSILSSSQFYLLPKLPQKNETRIKSGQNRPKNNHLYT
jgi:hypothetical protein